MNPNNKNFSVIAICLTIIVSLALLSRTGIYIKSLAGVEAGGKVSNTISVSGDGKVSVKPDMVQVSISFRELAPTSRGALDKVDTKVEEAMKVLKDNGIPENDITTTGLNVYTEYDYSNNVRRILGQRASQSLEIKIKKIDNKATKAAKVIDNLSTIDNIELGGIRFDIEDKTKMFTQARELAFNKAKQKAEELAKLSKVKLGKPVSISDSTYDVSPSLYYSNVAQMNEAAMKSVSADSQISTGEMNVSANISILWGIE